MKPFLWSIAVATLCLAPLAHAESCAELQPRGDVLSWLHSQAQDQLNQIFQCATPSSSVPVGFGRGTGSLYAGSQEWNDLQQAIGGALWGGKVLTSDASGVRLVNKMLDAGNERYQAAVYLTPSIVDHKSTVVLDYRIDDSVNTLGEPQSPAQVIVDKIAHGIRDEIREITVDGKGTGVFIGRAYVYKKMFTPGTDVLAHPDFSISDGQFADPAEWFMVANFYLDFRS